MAEVFQPASAEPGAVAREVRVWDPVVRIGHWTVVTLFAVAS